MALIRGGDFLDRLWDANATRAVVTITELPDPNYEIKIYAVLSTEERILLDQPGTYEFDSYQQFDIWVQADRFNDDYYAGRYAATIELFSDSGERVELLSVDRDIDVMRIGNLFRDQVGTSGDDIITGEATGNLQTPLDETFYVFQGNDIVDGGGGTDGLVLSGNFADYQITDNADGTITVERVSMSSGGIDEGRNIITNIEALGFADMPNVPISYTGPSSVIFGTSGDDDLIGTSNDDSILALEGNDLITGGAGADIIDGGAGSDVVYYTTSSAGVNVNLTSGTGQGGDAEGDTLVNIEHLSGSAFDDTLTGDTGNNSILGRQGDDSILGLDGNDWLRGDSGSDTIDGGSGADTSVYNTSSSAITIDLLNNVVTGGDAQGDTLISIENLWGSAYNDILSGDNSSNVIRGDAGDDIIEGRQGQDWLYGNAGDDTFVFNDGDGSDAIIDFETGAGSNDVIDLSNVTGFDSFADVQAAYNQNGATAVINFGSGNNLNLTNVDINQLHQDDFIFA
ncbi:MAG: calcium-binding protein [Pseudomonadota bacterium]